MALSPGFLCLKNASNAANIKKAITNGRLTVPGTDNFAYVFRDDGSDGQKAADNNDIPIYLNPVNADLSIADYAVLSLDTVTSTHSLLEALVKHAAFESSDLLVTAKQQIHGRGRRGERDWSSPPGCAMFSFTHRFGVKSKISEHIGFLQHMVALAIVQSIPQIPELKIKWPNDVYYRKSKIAGVVVNCHMGTKEIVSLIGVGINVDNREPSDCVNRIIREVHGSSDLVLPHQLMAHIVNQFTRSASLLQYADAFDEIKQSYMKRWMHTGQEVVCKGQEVVVDGVDDNGFLRVVPKDGSGSALTIGFDFDDVSLPVA